MDDSAERGRRATRALAGSQASDIPRARQRLRHHVLFLPQPTSASGLTVQHCSGCTALWDFPVPFPTPCSSVGPAAVSLHSAAPALSAQLQRPSENSVLCSAPGLCRQRPVKGRRAPRDMVRANEGRRTRPWLGGIDAGRRLDARQDGPGVLSGTVAVHGNWEPFPGTVRPAR